MTLNFSDLEGLHCGYVSRYLLSAMTQGTIKPVSKFTDFKSDDFKLPVQVSGRLITAGVYFEPKYGRIETPAEELKKVSALWVGKDIFTHHDAFWQIDNPTSTPADTVVGRILKTIWNEEEGAVDYIAEIYDRDVAYKIYTRSIKHVSVGFSNEVNMDDYEFPTKFDLEPRELSIVYRPKDHGESINIKDIQFN